MGQGWPLASALIALAAWTSSPRGFPAAGDGDADGWCAQLLIGFFAVLIIGVLGLETLGRVPLVGHLLLTGAVLALFACLAVAGRERLQLAHTTREARTDDLTGLANRRGLYEAADRALGDGHGLALVLLDVNRFKEINDSLGHNSGDELLCQLAARLTTSLASRGVIARLGGDEFVVLLENSDLHMTDNDDDANIVRSTIQMARSLHLLTVAEGVETAAHLHALTQYGCDTAQGSYLSRPIPADALTEWLQAHQPAPAEPLPAVNPAHSIPSHSSTGSLTG